MPNHNKHKTSKEVSTFNNVYLPRQEKLLMAFQLDLDLAARALNKHHKKQNKMTKTTDNAFSYWGKEIAITKFTEKSMKFIKWLYTLHYSGYG